MSDLAAAAAALGVPEALVQRSAEARAKASGSSVDEILAAWAGGGSAPIASAEPSPASTPESVPATDTGESAPVPTAPAPLPEVPAAAAVATAPHPTEVNSKEALRYPAVVTVPTVGLVERTVSAVPRWLAAVFFVLPLFGLIQLASATSNECGRGTELAVDRVTGALENCDGTAFEGRGLPGGQTDFVGLGGQIFVGQVVTAANCAGCHGPQGQGGTGPPLSGVVSTFSSCADHIEWVTKGSTGFQAEGRSTYGDAGKPITANMPSFAASLAPEQIAAVVAFERARFAGAPPDQVLADCGLVTPPEGEAAPGEGEAGVEAGVEPAPATTAAP